MSSEPKKKKADQNRHVLKILLRC